MLVVVLLPVALPWLRIRVSSIAIAKIELRQAERQAALRAFGAVTPQRAVFACVGRVAVAVAVKLHFS